MPHSREEEERGYHIAEEHVCAACLGIVHQWDTLLAKKEQHRGGRRLSAPTSPPPPTLTAWPRACGVSTWLCHAGTGCVRTKRSVAAACGTRGRSAADGRWPALYTSCGVGSADL